MTPVLVVGAGGFFGAVTRYLVGTLITKRFGATWPIGTFVINITGCFLLGFFVAWTAQRSSAMHDGWRLFFPVGFVGAYTTFSTYELEIFQLVELGAWARAMSYVLASTVVGFLAIASAVALAKRI